MPLGFRSRSAKPARKPSGYGVPAGQRIYAIGDIHGRDDLLRELLGRIEADIRAAPGLTNTLVLLGDYVDRGFGASRVIDMLLDPPAWASRFVPLKGNHEEMLLAFLAEPGFGADWRHFGGLETLASYGVGVRDVQLGRNYDKAAQDLAGSMPQAHIALLQSLKLSCVIGDFFFCHAGVRPGLALDEQSPTDLMWIRDEFLLSERDHGRYVVHGHTPVEEPDVRVNRMNIDTGAYATGRLTCAVLESHDVRFLITGTG
ncbi:MAG: serine/threonine protein phosphatase [Hyphomicrobiaceae bacterium]|nr:serine/threonine protein phosphatase [Hyphomicrobiaceae bacterium]